MKKLLYILITISITGSCLASGLDNDGGLDPNGDLIGDGPICVHLNLNSGVAEKYAYYNRHYSCPNFSLMDAQPLNSFERARVAYDVSAQTSFTPAPSPRLVYLTLKPGMPSSIQFYPRPKLLHPDDHSCRLGLLE